MPLIAASGVNVQPGQEVFIAADLDQPEFVKMLVEECYKRKAKKVVVDWCYQPLQKLHYRYRTLTTLSKLDNYEEARWQHYVDTIPCRIYLLSEDPDGLKGINQEKMAKSQQRLYPSSKYRDQIENKYQWCIAAVPGAAWAKLFHGLRTSEPHREAGRPFSPPAGWTRTPWRRGRPITRTSTTGASTSAVWASGSCATRAPTARTSPWA